MKERNIVTILKPKYKQTGAEEYYLEEKQRARSETENNFPRNLTILRQRERQTIQTKNIEDSYRWQHKPIRRSLTQRNKLGRSHSRINVGPITTKGPRKAAE